MQDTRPVSHDLSTEARKGDDHLLCLDLAKQATLSASATPSLVSLLSLELVQQFFIYSKQYCNNDYNSRPEQIHQRLDIYWKKSKQRKKGAMPQPTRDPINTLDMHFMPFLTYTFF